MSEQPRLLFCCFDVLPGPNGLSRRITEYLKGLGDRFQVVVLSTKTPDHSHIERYHGARLLRVPVGNGDLPSRIQAFDRAVRRQLESEEYVIAHFFDPFSGYALCDARAQLGFRLVYDAQSFPSQDLRFTHPAVEGDRRFLSKVRRQELYCLMNADAVICGSEVTRDWVLSLGAPPNSLHVFHQPVDAAPFTKDVVGRPDGSPMKLMHLGSQLPFQGLATLLRAMQLALRQCDLRLLIVGPKVPEGQPPLDDLVAELKLTGKVDFLPPVPHDELPKALATADVGMLTLDESERNETQGGPLAKVAEYLAAGRPVVAADHPVTRELVPEDARLTFPPGDFKALAEILVRLAGDAGLRVKMGERARAAATRFDASAVRGKLLDLYGALATRGKFTTQSETQGEVTQLRASGSPDTGRIVVRAPGETIDEEPPVVVGQSLEQPERDDERARAAVTEPGVTSSSPPDPTPIIKTRRKKGRGGTEEHTPIRPAPETEPTPITSAKSRRVISKSQKAVPPPASPLGEEPKTVPLAALKGELPPAVTVENPVPPAEATRARAKADEPTLRPALTPEVTAEPVASPEVELPKIIKRGPEPKSSRGTEQVPVLVPTPQFMPPALSLPPPPLPAPPQSLDQQPPPQPIKRTTEGKGVRSPALGSPLAGSPTALIDLPPEVAPPPPIKKTSEGKGLRSPLLPAALPPDEPEEISSDEIQSVEDEEPPTAEAPSAVAAATAAAGPPPKIDPWLAQLVFGYCPPEAMPFERPAPPTTFPGRER